MAPGTMLLAVSGTLLLLAVAPASATHPQPVGPSQTFAGFDHVKGNEWWVEMVLLGYQACARDTTVQARDDGGPWVALHRPSWAASCGHFVGSFHVEPGHRVQFRSQYGDTFVVESCWFTHPRGEEQCGAGSAFVAGFTPTAGNEWWVETDVSANKPLVGVDARVNGGPWHDLERTSWGHWAASFQVPREAIVEFRARSTSGENDFSPQGYVWPSRTPYPKPGDEPPTFRARFANPSGNEWWVQINTYSTQRLDVVTARVDSGPWTSLELRSWGDWATTMRAPAGSHVEFRACAGPGGHCEQSPPIAWPPP